MAPPAAAAASPIWPLAPAGSCAAQGSLGPQTAPRGPAPAPPGSGPRAPTRGGGGGGGGGSARRSGSRATYLSLGHGGDGGGTWALSARTRRRVGSGRSGGRPRRFFFTLLGLRGVYKVFIALGAPDRLEPDFTSRRRSLAQLGSRGRGLNSPPLEGVRRGYRGRARETAARLGGGGAVGEACVGGNKMGEVVLQIGGLLRPAFANYQVPSTLCNRATHFSKPCDTSGHILVSFLPVPAGAPPERPGRTASRRRREEARCLESQAAVAGQRLSLKWRAGKPAWRSQSCILFHTAEAAFVHLFWRAINSG